MPCQMYGTPPEFRGLPAGPFMRIEFPNAARDDFRWAQARLRVGSAPDNDLVLAADQSAPAHLRIELDRRGWILRVLADADRIHVNARPVREQALLRAGDVISVGECRLLLRDDDDPSDRPALRVAAQSDCTVALRAVAGPLSGRVLPIGDNLELGAEGSEPLQMPRGEQVSLQLGWDDGQLIARVPSASHRHPLRVNGAVVQQVAVQPGDQLALGPHRFIVDGPGMQPEPQIVLPEAEPEALPETAAGPAGEVWWLILTAAVLALGIALVLLLRG